MFLNEVILGKEHYIIKDDCSLTKPPAGFDSIVARGQTEPGNNDANKCEDGCDDSPIVGLVELCTISIFVRDKYSNYINDCVEQKINLV